MDKKTGGKCGKIGSKKRSFRDKWYGDGSQTKSSGDKMKDHPSVAALRKLKGDKD